MRTESAASGPYADGPSPSRPIAGTPSKLRILRSLDSVFARRRPSTKRSTDMRSFQSVADLVRARRPVGHLASARQTNGPVVQEPDPRRTAPSAFVLSYPLT